MNQQDRAVWEKVVELLEDNREYIEANERPAYLELYDKAIADANALLMQPADHSEDVLHMVRPQNCGTGYCSCIECPFKKGGA